MKIFILILVFASIFVFGVLGGASSCVGIIKSALSLSDFLQVEYIRIIKEGSEKSFEDQYKLVNALAEALLKHSNITFRDVIFLNILNNKKPFTALCLISFYST
ncbi:hypothetical protein ACKWTF_015813 [Chironomus riparius]